MSFLVHHKQTSSTEDDRLSLSEASLLIERQWTPFEERKQSFLHDLRRCRRKKGPMTRDELKQILQRGNAGAMSDEDVNYVFKRLDLNHDKVITEEGTLQPFNTFLLFIYLFIIY